MRITSFSHCGSGSVADPDSAMPAPASPATSTAAPKRARWGSNMPSTPSAAAWKAKLPAVPSAAQARAKMGSWTPKRASVMPWGTQTQPAASAAVAQPAPAQGTPASTAADASPAATAAADAPPSRLQRLTSQVTGPAAKLSAPFAKFVPGRAKAAELPAGAGSAATGKPAPGKGMCAVAGCARLGGMDLQLHGNALSESR